MKKMSKNSLIIILICSMVITSFFFFDYKEQKTYAKEDNLFVSNWTNTAKSWDENDSSINSTLFQSANDSIIANISMTGWQANWTAEGNVPGEALIINNMWGDKPYQIRSENMVSVVPGRKYTFEFTVENRMMAYRSSEPTEKNITIIVGDTASSSANNLLFKTIKIGGSETKTFSFNVSVPRNYQSDSLRVMLAYGSYYYSYSLTKEVESGNISEEDASLCAHSYAYPTTENIKAHGTLSFSNISFTEKEQLNNTDDFEESSVEMTTTNPYLVLDVGNFMIDWHDEFDGKDLNKDYWTTQVGNGSLYGLWEWGNKELEYYKSGNVKVSDGTLKINAKYEKNAGIVGSTTYNFSSGRINTASHVEVGKGYVEAKIKVPSRNGIWPAFWMLGTNEEQWPACGEIDIMESFDKNNITRSSIHYPDWNGEDVFFFTEHNNSSKTEWHTYGCYRDGKKCVFYFDRKPVETYETQDIYTGYKQGERSVLNDNYYLILNVACGGNMTDFTPGSSLNDEMEVDYVRYYKITDQEIPVEKSEEETTRIFETENKTVAFGNPETNQNTTSAIKPEVTTVLKEETTEKPEITSGIKEETPAKSEETTGTGEEITTKNESGIPDKNAIDIVILKAIINSQKSLGANVDEDIDSWQYEWSDDDESRLTGVNWYNCGLCGNISFSGLEELTDINVMNNQLTSINVSDNQQLKYLFCTYNNLKSLDITLNKKLKYLDCAYNQIEELDVSNNKNIEVIHCGHNGIRTLDVTTNQRLRNIQCGRNVEITGCDEEKVNISFDDETEDDSIRQYTIIDSDVTGELSKETNLYGHEFYGYQFTPDKTGYYTFYVTGKYDTYGALTDTTGKILAYNDDCIGVNFGFNYYCEEGVPYKLLGRLYSPKENGVVEFNIVNSSDENENPRKIRRISDVIHLTELIKDKQKNSVRIEKSVYAGQYQWSDEEDSRLIGINWEGCDLTGEITFSGLDAINSINCKENHISKLDISDNDRLQYLDCSGNDLEQLDITGNMKMLILNCRDNQLKLLDLLNNTKLIYLDCSNNQLSELDLTENNELWAVYCDENVIVTGIKDSIIHIVKNPVQEETVSESVGEIETTVATETTTKKKKKKKKTVETTKAPLVKKVVITKATRKKKSAKKVKVIINKVVGSGGYQLRFYKKKADAKEGKNLLVKTTIQKNVKTLTVSNEKLKNVSVLYVKVRAYKLINNRKKYGEWSGVKKVQTENIINQVRILT